MDLVETEVRSGEMQLELLRGEWPAPTKVAACDSVHKLLFFAPPIRFDGISRFPTIYGSQFHRVSPVFFTPADVLVESHGSGGKTRALRLTFTPETYRALLDRDPQWSRKQLEAALSLSGSPVEPLMMQLYREATAPGFASETLITALCTAAIVEVARVLRGVDTEPVRGQLNGRQLSIIRERAESLADTPPSLGELAHLCGMSERNLLRLFRQTTGQSVAAFVRDIRCGRAKKLLGRSDLPLKEIAYRLGFSSHSSFTAAFRRETGLSPAAFRRAAMA